jgi:hypothetical protein
MKNLRLVFPSFFTLLLPVLSGRAEVRPLKADLPLDPSVTIQNLTPSELEVLRRVQSGKELNSASVISALLEANEDSGSDDIEDRAERIEKYSAPETWPVSLRKLSEQVSVKDKWNAKVRYEKSIESRTGKPIRYQKNSVHLDQVFEDGLMQCFSGTLLNHLIWREKTMSQPEAFAKLRWVAIYEKGHVLPGFIEKNKAGKPELYGIESTLAGKALGRYGEISKIQKPLRILDGDAFALLEIFKNRLDSQKVPAFGRKLLAYTGTKYGFDPQRLEKLIQKNLGPAESQIVIPDNGFASRYEANSSPVGFGTVVLPEGIVERKVVATFDPGAAPAKKAVVKKGRVKLSRASSYHGPAWKGIESGKDSEMLKDAIPTDRTEVLARILAGCGFAVDNRATPATLIECGEMMNFLFYSAASVDEEPGQHQQKLWMGFWKSSRQEIASQVIFRLGPESRGRAAENLEALFAIADQILKHSAAVDFSGMVKSIHSSEFTPEELQTWGENMRSRVNNGGNISPINLFLRGVQTLPAPSPPKKMEPAQPIPQA